MTNCTTFCTTLVQTFQDKSMRSSNNVLYTSSHKYIKFKTEKYSWLVFSIFAIFVTLKKFHRFWTPTKPKL